MKKCIFILILAIGGVITSQAQNTQVAKGGASIVESAEHAPEFPGGAQALRDYLVSNINYPKDALEKGISGQVLVSFVVNKDGSVAEVAVQKKVQPSLDAEAARAVRSMPKWKPATDKGQPVRMRLTLPVTFKLPADASIQKGESSDGADEGQILEEAEVNPEFPGGVAALMNYLSSNIHYPKEAYDKGVQGRVLIQFVVNKVGRVSNASVLKGVDALLDAEALRVVKSMPTWKPGMQKGQPVRVRYTIPITFKLGEKEGGQGNK